MKHETNGRLESSTVCFVVLFSLFVTKDVSAQILPGAPSLVQRINVAPYVGYLNTSSQNIKDSVAFGFTAEATLFSDIKCSGCPDELGAGTAYLATKERTQIQDAAWLAAYWFFPWRTLYFGVQGGYSKFYANAVDASDAKKSVYLEADGIRGAALFGWQFFNPLYIELAAAGRYFPAPKSVLAPLSSNPFGAYSAGINIGVVFGESLDEKEKKAKEKKLADAASSEQEEKRLKEDKEFRNNQSRHLLEEQQFRQRQIGRWDIEDAKPKPPPSTGP